MFALHAVERFNDFLIRDTCQDGTGGRLAVVGSCHMFSDAYIEKEGNDRVLDVIMQWLSGKLPLNAIDAEAPDIADYHFLPSTTKMSEQPRVCLQDGDEVDMLPIQPARLLRLAQVPRDFTSLLETPLFQLDTAMIPESIRMYDALGIPHEQLQLIPPAFETPLPPLQPAVWPHFPCVFFRVDHVI